MRVCSDLSGCGGLGDLPPITRVKISNRQALGHPCNLVLAQWAGGALGVELGAYRRRLDSICPPLGSAEQSFHAVGSECSAHDLATRLRSLRATFGPPSHWILMEIPSSSPLRS